MGLMGDKVNSHWFNGAAWATAITVSILSVILMVQSFWPGH